MEIVIITGMSGAGKSHTINVFEDMGYNCIDNMPPALISKFIELCRNSSVAFDNLAIVVDSRTGELFDGLINELKKLNDSGIRYKMLFLEASDDVLMRRYKETRRRHPLEAAEGSISSAIAVERQKLSQARKISDYVIDTSLFSVKNLREQIMQTFSMGKKPITITICSFGFKYGPKSDTDMLFDVRCLPNPFYIDNLRLKTGLDKIVFDYVFQWDDSKIYFDKVYSLIDFLLPKFIAEGKNNMQISFGCTGGKHRSVAFAQLTASKLKENGYRVAVVHRDIDKN
jgi:UPF0042 nucleotide-binding protein csac_1160